MPSPSTLTPDMGRSTPPDPLSIPTATYDGWMVDRRVIGPGNWFATGLISTSHPTTSALR